MFYIQLFFEDNKIEFAFSMNFAKVQKNDSKFFDEMEKIKSFVFEEGQKIDFNQLISKFNEFKKTFADKFLIDKNYDQKVEFKISNDNFDSKENIFKFIKNHKDLNIILYSREYNTIINYFKNENYPNLKISFENCEHPISYKEFYGMYKKLDEIISFINHYNLSPLEKVFLVYDIVKSNVYNKEDASEHYSKSRDLNQIVNGDKIVCVGYANLINYLLTNLDIKNKCIITYNKEKNVGHQKNYLYLNDPKYGIKQVFFLDVTADSKKSDDYIDNYRCFLKPFNFFSSDKSIIFKPKELTLLTKTNEEIYAEVSEKNHDSLSYLLKLLRFIDIKYSLLETLSQIYSNEEKLKELIELIKKEYNQKGVGEIEFKTALYKVRRIEYINNIFKGELSEEYISNVYNKNHRLNDNVINFLKAIGIYEEYEINKQLADIENIDIDALRMRLLKALKLSLNDIPNNQYIKKM